MSDTPRTLPDNIAQIMESVDVECGLCANEGADDIAGLLREVYAAMTYLIGKIADGAAQLAERDAEVARLKAENSKIRSGLKLSTSNGRHGNEEGRLGESN